MTDVGFCEGCEKPPYRCLCGAEVDDFDDSVEDESVTEAFKESDREVARSQEWIRKNRERASHDAKKD